MNKLHYKIEVKGKVQGVWFRKYTVEKAGTLGLKGFVKNDIDNKVYIEAEGDKQDLATFIDWLYIGSPLSNVNEVVFQNGSMQNFEVFEIQF